MFVKCFMAQAELDSEFLVLGQETDLQREQKLIHWGEGSVLLSIGGFSGREGRLIDFIARQHDPQSC